MIEGGGHGFWGNRDEVYVGTGKVLYPVCHSGRRARSRLAVERLSAAAQSGGGHRKRVGRAAAGFKTEGATSRSSFNLSWIVYAAVFVQYGMSAAFVVILVGHLAEWIWYRYPWYVQSFNIASFALVVAAAT